MATRAPFAPGEWYHCYNRGVDKRNIFLDAKDRERFLLLLYLANGANKIHISNMRDVTLRSALLDDTLDRGTPLVDIGAYALMPNHVHFAIRQPNEGNIALFMQKVFTGYTMYFNKKYDRTGALFAGTFKSKHVPDDRYFKWLISYIHLNPAELFEFAWKDGAADTKHLEKQLKEYSYSSLRDFLSITRPENKIISDSVFDLFDIKPSKQNFKEFLEEAQAYHREYQG